VAFDGTLGNTLAAIDIGPTIISLLVGMIIPHIVDLVTHSSAPKWMKSWLAVVCAAITGALTTVTWQGWDDWRVFVFNIFIATVSAFTSHTAGASEFVQRSTADFGIGKRHAPPPDPVHI
jgi:hypothetical protein